MIQTAQPKVEWGFYAVTPRIVRTQYKDLSHAEKWLYVCLKDLCGEKGMCYRTLRSLSEETNISIASLSSMIPELQKAGLIHAEKKRRSNSGKEIWHISIVDIWQANQEYCSKIEQSSQIVQNLNNDVQNLNEVDQVCSENEQDCSNFPYRRITIEEETITEERTIEEREEVASATARSQSSSSQEISQDETVKREAVKPSQKDTAHGIVSDSAPGSPVVGNASTPGSSRPERQDTNKVTQPPAPKKPPTNTIPKRPKQQPITTPISPEAQRILDDWVSLFTKKIVINQGDIDAAEHLVPTNITCEEMRQERLWLFSTDNPQKPWYRKIGVCLADIDKKYSQWQSLQDAPKPADKAESNEHRVSSFGTPGYNFADEFYPSEAEKKRYRAAQAQAQEVKA